VIGSLSEKDVLDICGDIAILITAAAVVLYSLCTRHNTLSFLPSIIQATIYWMIDSIRSLESPWLYTRDSLAYV
jgi:hypothetical protein